MPSLRFRFGEFVLSPRQRLLLRNGAAIPLIPRYFDLLVLLVSRRREAVAKQTIFEQVWSDVVVSDGALAQAIRTLRRTLGDESREPRYIRTVSRHGYQFVWPDVIEEHDDEPLATTIVSAVVEQAEREPIEALVQQLLTAAAAPGDSTYDEARDLAERLHVAGTAAAIAHIARQPRHAMALAIMRDTRWNVPGAGAVPLVSDSEAVAAIAALVRLRLAAVRRTIAYRWLHAAAFGALGGAMAGAFGGLLLTLAPASTARWQSAVALAAIGALAGSIGAGAVAAGLAGAEAVARSRRGVALVACAAAAGALVAATADLVFRALLDGLFGIRLLHASAAIEGLVIGAAAGAAYAIATSRPGGGGIAAPRGRDRVMTVVLVAVACAAACTLLAASGRPLIGGLVHEVARRSQDAQLGLGPLGRLIGEPGFGPVTRILLSAFEGVVFGGSLAFGLTRRAS